jgi:aryl carrier-like protein
VLRLASEDAARDPALLAELLDGSPADYLKITPSHLTALLSGVPEPVLRPRRALILGGEGAQHSLVRRLTEADWTVCGHYGPTETTIGVLAGQLSGQTATPSRTVPLRRPLPGVTCYVLDEYGAPVPPGCRGELYLGGALVTRGYAGMPATTAAAFLPDPFSREPGARMYRTGDLVRRLSDEEFEFCGRLDRQRKVRGHRIEPGEVEAALTGLPGVSQAVVIVTGEVKPRLTGYVVPEAGRVLTEEELLAELARQLPAYLIPETVVLLGQLPMTRSGKLDTAALPRPRAAADDGPDFAGPVTAHEVLLADVWRSVLGAERISVETPFFAAGGDSITAIEVVARARARGFPLSVRDLFEQQTIRRLAAAAAVGPAEPLATRAARTGLGAALAPVAVRLPVADRGAASAALTEATAGADGIEARWDGGTVTLTADPVLASDRDLARLATLLAAGGRAPGPVAGAHAPGAVRLTLSDQVAAALSEFPAPDAAIHDAYGTRPADLAAAAVLDAVARCGTGRDAAVSSIVLADCADEDSPAPARHTLPGAVRLHHPGPDGWADPGQLLRTARAAVRAATDAAGGWVAAALSGQADVPGTVLRLLPLPPGAALTRAGWTAEGTARTTVILAGQDLLVLPGGDDAARLAEGVRSRLESLAAHCAATRPVYHADDFPDAGLDEEALARLLGQIGGA